MNSLTADWKVLVFLKSDKGVNTNLKLRRTSWHIDFHLTFSHLTISVEQRNRMITHIVRDATRGLIQATPQLLTEFPSWSNTEEGTSIKGRGLWPSLPTSNISLCSLRKGAFLCTVKWSGWDSLHSWVWKDRVKCLQRYRHPVVQIAAVLSWQYMHLCDILKVVILFLMVCISSSNSCFTCCADGPRMQGQSQWCGAVCVTSLFVLVSKNLSRKPFLHQYDSFLQ